MYVLDTAGSEGRDPLDDFRHLQRELELYAPGISSRPSLIIANKMDQHCRRFIAPWLSHYVRRIPCDVCMHSDTVFAIIGAEDNLSKLRHSTDLAVLPVR